MKKLLKIAVLSVLCFFASSVLMMADDLDEDQLNLRSEIMQFLKEEGFVPSIESDGDIKFKKEGVIYFITVSSTDSSPMYVYVAAYYNYSDRATKRKIEQASIELNKYKGAKIFAANNNYKIQAEMFVRNANAFCSVFYKLMKQIGYITEDVLEECDKVS